MAVTLEEFLVSVRYAVDQSSQQRFTDTLKRAALSVGGVAGEVVALGAGILKLSESMASAGEQFYWMSQRLGDSVGAIQGASFALTNLGVSAGEANANIERFGAWTRNMGPAATAYLRTMGVTATDTVGRLNQLSDYFRRNAADPNSLQYSLMLRRAAQVGLDEMTMRAMMSGQYQRFQQQAFNMRTLVWGRGQEDRGPQQFAEQSQLVMNQFRQMGLFFDTLKQKFGLGLFQAILPDLEKINALLISLLPTLEGFFTHLISYAPTVLHFLEFAIKGFDFLLATLNAALDIFEKLPHSIDAFAVALLTLPSVLRLAKSPIFLMIVALGALLVTLQDYMAWQENQELKAQGKGPKWKTAFDWSETDKFVKGMGLGNKDIEHLAEGLGLLAVLGPGLISTARGVIALARSVGVLKAAQGAGTARSLLSTVFGGMGGMLSLFTAMAFGLKHDEFLTPEQQRQRDERNKEEARRHGIDPNRPPEEAAQDINKRLGYTGHFLHDTGVFLHHLFMERTSGPALEPSAIPHPGAVYGPFPAEKGEQVPPHGAEGLQYLPGGRVGTPKAGGLGTEPYSAPGPQKVGQAERLGGYATASAGNDWTVPAGFGGTEADDRTFEMERRGFELMVDRLEDIYLTLSDMAEAEGAGQEFRGGGGEGGAAAPMGAPRGSGGGAGVGGGGGAGVGGGPIPEAAPGASGELAKAMGLTPEEYNKFRQSVGKIESRGRYDIMGGSSGRFAGKYQMGAAEIAETARSMGEQTPATEAFLKNPEMQERFFERYTLNHHRWLLAHNAKYRAMSPEDQAAWLGYAHNQGAGGANRAIDTGVIGRDAFGTAGTAYSTAIHAAFNRPVGTGPEGIGAGAFLAQQHQQREINIHNETHVSVAPGPNAASTVAGVADAQHRVHEQHVRASEGKLR